MEKEKEVEKIKIEVWVELLNVNNGKSFTQAFKNIHIKYSKKSTNIFIGATLDNNDPVGW